MARPYPPPMPHFCQTSYIHVYVLLFSTNNYQNFEFGDPTPPLYRKTPYRSPKHLYKKIFYTITCLSANNLRYRNDSSSRT